MVKWALTLFAIALLIAGFFLFRDDGATGAVIAGPAPVEPGSERAPAALDELELPAKEDEVDTAVRSEVDAVPAPQVELAKATPKALRFEARVVEVLEGGAERDVADGEIELVFWSENQGLHEKVPIVAGRIEFDSEGRDLSLHGTGKAPAQVQARSVESGGKSYRLLDKEQRYRFGQQDVVIRVQGLRAMVLNVVDDETGAHLNDVAVLKIRSWRRNKLAHPGHAVPDEDRIEGPSPFELKADGSDLHRQGTTLFVGSPGYAWVSIKVLLDAGGERWVRLKRGGGLSVYFDREVQRSGAHLRLHSEPGAPLAEVEVHGKSEVRLEGLAPAKYEVIVETGDWWDETFRLGVGEVEIVAGEVTDLEMVLKEPPVAEKARLSGILVLPKEWGMDRFYLASEFQGIVLDGGDGRATLHQGSFDPVQGEIDTYAFDFGDVQVGEYVLTLSQVEYAEKVEVGPGGNRDVLLELPPPVDVTVLVIDATTGKPSDLSRLLWHCVRPEGVMGGGLETAMRASDSEVFEIRVPACEVTFSTFGGEYSAANKTIFAEPGLEVELEVRPSAGAILSLRDGDNLIPWPERDYGEAEAIGHGGKMSVRGHRKQGLWFTVTEPGRYLVTIPEVEGYEKHEPLEVSLVEGETPVIPVDLVRVP